MGPNSLNKTETNLPAPIPGAGLTVRLYLFITLLLGLASMPAFFTHGQSSGNFLGSYSLRWVALLSGVILLALAEFALLVALVSPARPRLERLAGMITKWLSGLRIIGLLALAGLWVLYAAMILWQFEYTFRPFLTRAWLFFLLTGIGAVIWHSIWKRTPVFWAIAAVMVIYAAGLKALAYLPDISALPFSLEWSEASRYYYAALPFSRQLFGFDIPLSTLHPSRYLMQGLAYLIPGVPLWGHRLWQVLLWLGMSLLTGAALMHRMKMNGRGAALVGTLWSMLFLLQGPVYYHLQVCVIIILYGFDRDRFWKSLWVVAAASAWAGISRVNWIPVPAFLAVTLYLLERPVCSSRGWLDYLWKPAAWGVVGGAAAVASQAAYILVSGHEDTSGFSSSFTSALLWYRLLPNPTYPAGVIPDVLAVSAPLLVLLVGVWLVGRRDWHLLRAGGIALMMAVLFAGGLVVSTKIGGGSNLHNMDAYLVLLLAAGVSVGLGRFASETGGEPRLWRPWSVILLALLLPVIWSIDVRAPFARRDLAQGEYDLSRLRPIIQEYSKKGEVLFITQRQLLLFGYIPDVPMTPDYELMTLSEMSISNNEAQLAAFYKNLSEHRFALIVADRQNPDMIRDPRWDAFAEENNAWVEKISRPILANYQSEMFFDTQGVELLVPRQ